MRPEHRHCLPIAPIRKNTDLCAITLHGASAGLPQDADVADTVLSTIGATLRRLRAERCLSQEDVASALGVDRAHISRIESGKHNISVLVLAKLALTLGARLDEVCAAVSPELLKRDLAEPISRRGPKKPVG